MWAWMSLYDASGKSAGMWIPMVFATMPNLVDDACTAFPRKRASRAAILMKSFDPTDFATVYITLSLPVWKQNRQNPDAIWGYVFLAMEKMLGEWTKTELYPLLRAS